MRTRKPALLAAPILAALMVASTALVGLPAQAGYGDYGAFSTKCAYSHANNDDPILYPGEQGAAHRHHYFGNTTTNYKTKTGSLENGAANCDRTEDHSSYWLPALYNDGVEIPYEAAHVYYRNTNVKDDTVIQPFPRGFRMIAGTDAHPEAPEGKGWRTAEWTCSDSPPGEGTPEVPASCHGAELVATVTFPSCWDGKRLTSADESHVVYPWENVKPNTCPATHPVALPELTEWVRWDPGTDYSGITIASGDSGTLHADFWNGWDVAEQLQLVEDCLRVGQECGTVGD